VQRSDGLSCAAAGALRPRRRQVRNKQLAQHSSRSIPVESQSVARRSGFPISFRRFLRTTFHSSSQLPVDVPILHRSTRRSESFGFYQLWLMSEIDERRGG
jgi:hypothetical protein